MAYEKYNGNFIELARFEKVQRYITVNNNILSVVQMVITDDGKLLHRDIYKNFNPCGVKSTSQNWRVYRNVDSSGSGRAESCSRGGDEHRG